jgi:predicted ATPase with chaperone activity
MQVISRSWMPFAGAILSAVLLTSIPIANAQTQTPSGQGQSAQSPAISEQKLDATATALQRVTSVKQDYQQKLNSASPDEQQRIATEANDAMSKAVTDQGLSLEEFDTIIRVAQNDSNVREKILQRVKPK